MKTNEKAVPRGWTGSDNNCYTILVKSDDLIINIGKQGADTYAKTSYPIRYGIYDEIKTDAYLFQFNLSGEIKYLRGRGKDWTNPGEWLKRTSGNDWVYYSSGEYDRTYSYFGEYYFPCFSYPTNSIMGQDPFRYNGVRQARNSLESLLQRLRQLMANGLPAEAREAVSRITSYDGRVLALRANYLHGIIGERVTVLPPDTRHVDYDVIPLTISDGCLYNCGFCRVKSGRSLTRRSRSDILGQIDGLKQFYGPDLLNHNSLFLGQHDGLMAGEDMIMYAVETAYEAFGFDHSYMKEPALFLFGSADSLLRSDEALFGQLNSMPFSTYINVGLESADSATLALMKKPISPDKVRDAFVRLTEINGRYEKVEVSANFVIAPGLPESHIDSFLELTGRASKPSMRRAIVYISPVTDDGARNREKERALLAQFSKIKRESALPVYLYLIQRL